MPLYEYECAKCGVFERIQKFSDPLLKKCPTCGKPVHKKVSVPSIQFKGEGWWVTDYGWKSKHKGGEAGEGGKPEGGKSEGAKSEGAKSEGAASSETKPAAKPKKPASGGKK